MDQAIRDGLSPAQIWEDAGPDFRRWLLECADGPGSRDMDAYRAARRLLGRVQGCPAAHVETAPEEDPFERLGRETSDDFADWAQGQGMTDSQAVTFAEVYAGTYGSSRAWTAAAETIGWETCMVPQPPDDCHAGATLIGPNVGQDTYSAGWDIDAGGESSFGDALERLEEEYAQESGNTRCYHCGGWHGPDDVIDLPPACADNVGAPGPLVEVRDVRWEDDTLTVELRRSPVGTESYGSVDEDIDVPMDSLLAAAVRDAERARTLGRRTVDVADVVGWAVVAHLPTDQWERAGEAIEPSEIPADVADRIERAWGAARWTAPMFA